MHIAPAFGEDDYWASKNSGIPLVNPVDSKGHFTEKITDFYVEDSDKNVIEMNSDIIRYMYANEFAVLDGTLEHNYPHCWRCRNPLIYKAMDAWYFSIDKIKDRLIELNEEINWVPETVKHGRFGNWLQNARDWNISRNRYWSTPIPVWECDCCHTRTVLGSIDEIYEASGVRPTDLHRQYLDTVTFQCQCGGTMHRINEVLDCWFESAAVPFAQKHYPFENKEWFENHLPSDFIVEYTGQIRCWFYYLHVMSVALFDKIAFKNCIVHGTLLAKDGKKLSKSSKNYTDPMELLRKYGSDAYRLYLFQSNAMLLGDSVFDETGVLETLQQMIFPLWNSVGFFTSYAEIDNIQLDASLAPTATNTLDKWILAKLYEAEQNIQNCMSAYEIDKYTKHLASLIDALTNWYIRRSRRRFWHKGLSGDKKSGYETLYYVLINICKLAAPVMPIIAERLFKHLTNSESVHLSDWPSIPEEYKNEALLTETESVRSVIKLARAIRNKNNIKNRIPLQTMTVVLSNPDIVNSIESQSEIICEEVNVKQLKVATNAENIATVHYNPNYQTLKIKFGKQMPQIADSIREGRLEIDGNGYIVKLPNSDEVALAAEDVQVKYQAKEGSEVAADPSAIVVLDLTLTDSLKREGLARDIVRNIQDMRKQIGCEIMDNINILITGPYPEEFIDYILGETLAQLVADVSDKENKFSLSTDEGSPIEVFVERK